MRSKLVMCLLSAAGATILFSSVTAFAAPVADPGVILPDNSWLWSGVQEDMADKSVPNNVTSPFYTEGSGGTFDTFAVVLDPSSTTTFEPPTLRNLGEGYTLTNQGFLTGTSAWYAVATGPAVSVLDLQVAFNGVAVPSTVKFDWLAFKNGNLVDAWIVTGTNGSFSWEPIKGVAPSSITIPGVGEGPHLVPLPAAAWMGFSLLGGIGAVARWRRKPKEL